MSETHSDLFWWYFSPAQTSHHVDRLHHGGRFRCTQSSCIHGTLHRKKTQITKSPVYNQTMSMSMYRSYGTCVHVCVCVPSLAQLLWGWGSWAPVVPAYSKTPAAQGLHVPNVVSGSSLQSCWPSPVSGYWSESQSALLAEHNWQARRISALQAYSM